MYAEALHLAAKNCPQGRLALVADALRLQTCNASQATLASARQLQLQQPQAPRAPSTAAAAVVHVDAVRGSDSTGDGSPGAPFRSLPVAQAAARKALRAAAETAAETAAEPAAAPPSVAVEIHAGRYLLAQPLLMDARDSGSVYRAAAGEAQPVVSGAIEVPAGAFAPVAGRPGVVRARVQLPAALAAPKAANDDCALEQDTDLAGNDLQTTTASSPADCCSKCKAFKGCKFFTIEHAEGGRCWLKSSDAGRRPYSDHVSGQPGGGPPPPPPPPPPPFSFGPSPPPVNQLFVDGVRQVRERS